METTPPVNRSLYEEKSVLLPNNAPTFVDVFAGCGGLSLGLMSAGWKGLFAVEKNADAFKTLSTNLLQENTRYCFEWPDWLPQSAHCAIDFVATYKKQLESLAGTVDMLVGGPPCQGYSAAGRRDPDDPRNQLFRTYLELVALIQPKIVLIENVRGMTQDFLAPKEGETAVTPVNYADDLTASLSAEYHPYSRLIDLASFGLPQARTRFFVVAIRKTNTTRLVRPEDPFTKIESDRLRFLRSKGLTENMSAKAALSDLEVNRNGKVPTEEKRFQAISYKSPITPYQKSCRGSETAPPPDTRLPNHCARIATRFTQIIQIAQTNGRLNVTLRSEELGILATNKQVIRVMDPDRPSPTITGMPDDLLHYSEPRTLTVRENARLQSFPDWFSFQGKYTTGGKLRKVDVPRYTQVANAVPPLVAEALGKSLIKHIMPTVTNTGLLVNNP